jgi:hypothetical protein
MIKKRDGAEQRDRTNAGARADASRSGMKNH